MVVVWCKNRAMRVLFIYVYCSTNAWPLCGSLYETRVWLTKRPKRYSNWRGGKQRRQKPPQAELVPRLAEPRHAGLDASFWIPALPRRRNLTNVLPNAVTKRLLTLEWPPSKNKLLLPLPLRERCQLHRQCRLRSETDDTRFSPFFSQALVFFTERRRNIDKNFSYSNSCTLDRSCRLCSKFEKPRCMTDTFHIPLLHSYLYNGCLLSLWDSTRFNCWSTHRPIFPSENINVPIPSAHLIPLIQVIYIIVLLSNFSLLLIRN